MTNRVGRPRSARSGAEHGVVGGLQLEAGDGVVLVGVHAEGHHDGVGGEGPHVAEGIVQGGEPGRGLRAHGQRVVAVGVDPGPLAPLVGVAGEERVLLAGVAVQVGDQHVAPGPEDVLGAVAVVVVDVDDRHPVQPAVEQGLGRGRGVVDEAVAAVEVEGGVVARRPAEREGGPLAAQDQVDPREGHVGGGQDRLGGARHDRRAGVEGEVGEPPVDGLGLVSGPCAGRATPAGGRRSRRCAPPTRGPTPPAGRPGSARRGPGPVARSRGPSVR